MFRGNWRGTGGGGGGGSTVDVIVPFAYAAMTDTSSGSGVGVTWTYDSGSKTFSVTFNSARSDTSYTVVTDEEFADGTGSRYMMVLNKATTGFDVEMYGSYGPSGDPKIIMVYAQNPVVSVGSGGSGGTADLVWGTHSSAAKFTFTGSTNAVSCDVSSNAIEVELPQASSKSGKIYTIKHSAGPIATNSITISSAGGTVDGLATVVVSQNLSSTRASSDGTNWFII
tara:strand:- start:95 stop:772 length:678 start_codon:yes stop_codon:yes gene_type:complete